LFPNIPSLFVRILRFTDKSCNSQMLITEYNQSF